MKLLIFGLGDFSKELLRSSNISVEAIFDIDPNKVGLDFNNVEVKPGILLDNLPKTWRKKPISARLEDVKKIVRDSDADVGMISINSFAKKSAIAYAEILIESGINVINVTPIPIYNNNRLRKKAKKQGIYLLGDLIKPFNDPFDQVILFRNLYRGEVFVMHRISFDLASLVIPEIKKELESKLSNIYKITYTFDPRRELKGYAELNMMLFTKDIEINLQVRYPHRELVVNSTLDIIEKIKRKESIEEIRNRYFYL